jgi:hypothetical protein
MRLLASNNLRFALHYMGLGAVVVMSSIGLWGTLQMKGKASKSSVTAIQKQLSPSDEKLINTACLAAINDAAGQGVAVTKCELDKTKNAFQKQGDKAIITLHVEAAAVKQYWTIAVALDGSVWQPAGVRIFQTGPIKK